MRFWGFLTIGLFIFFVLATCPNGNLRLHPLDWRSYTLGGGLPASNATENRSKNRFRWNLV